MLWMCIFYISLMEYITHESMLEKKYRGNYCPLPFTDKKAVSAIFSLNLWQSHNPLIWGVTDSSEKAMNVFWLFSLENAY